jgi:hypothetical protein
MRSGIANLPLHGGKAPKWLFSRMVKLAEGIIDVFIEEYGTHELIHRLSDPFWFQAFGCVLGFDWHSSGVTTVTCGALKEAIDPAKHDLALAGGKGKTSRKTPKQIDEAGERLNLSSQRLDELKYSSRLAAKVDSAAVQDNHQLYHHVIIFDKSGTWSVIQQGLDPEFGYARRYHWLSDNVTSFVTTPHDAIIGETQQSTVLDMTSVQSIKSRKLSVDIVNEDPNRLKGYFVQPRLKFQETLDSWATGPGSVVPTRTLSMPKVINWSKLRAAYEVQPKNFEELISLPGIGPSSVRALALMGELIYGEKPSFSDPVKFSFTVGGKDGVPYPVDRKLMDRITEVIRQGVDEAKCGNREKFQALQRLRRFVPEDVN